MTILKTACMHINTEFLKNMYTYKSPNLNSNFILTVASKFKPDLYIL